ncbi:MAG: DUF2357 domain-containing protein [Propionivibrio sp.]
MEPLALHRAVFAFPSGVAIDIESALGHGEKLEILPPQPHLSGAEAETEAEALASGGILPMCWRDAGALFERFQLREDTDYFVDITLPLAQAESEKRSVSHAAWPFDARLASAFKRDPARRWKALSKGGKEFTVITGQLRLRSHAGILALGTEFGETLFAEVACRKLRYFEEFKELLDCLADELAELLLAYDSPVSLTFGTTERLAENDAALHFLMRRVMAAGHLPSAAEEIASAPHARMFDVVETVPIEEIEEPDTELIVDGLDISALGSGGPLARFFGGYTPKELPQRDIRESVDTPENRYAKGFLEHCRDIANTLEFKMAARKRKAAQREARAWSAQLDEMLQRSLWREVGPFTQFPGNSQVLQRKRGYKDLFKLDVSLRASLALSWKEGAQVADGLAGDVRPVNQIYEYWCFFALRKILQEFCKETGGGNFIVVSKDGLRIQLAKGKRSECRFEYTSSSGAVVKVSLFYNKKFRRPKSLTSGWSGSYTAAFDPDFSVHAQSNMAGTQSHWLHFDAKYRLERREIEDIFDGGPDEEESAEGGDDGTAYETELTRVHKQDDLFKMHTYRDGILSSRGAYILFPGDGAGGKIEQPGQNLFIRHPSAFGGTPAYKIPSVGAFDLTPKGSALQSAAIKELLVAALENAARGYGEEKGFFA